MQSTEKPTGKRLGKYVILVDKKLGEGSFATVYKGYRHDNPKQVVAVKRINKAKIEKSAKMMQSIAFETSLLSRTDLDCTNIVKLFDVHKTPNNWYLFMEFCSGGDLLALIKKYKTRILPEPLRKRVMCNILMGLNSLHAVNILHRDLKPANLLLTSLNPEDAWIKIADFGLAREVAPQSLAATICGSPLYMAPEVFDQKYGKPADVWSAGCIFYEICTGNPPFTGLSVADFVVNLKTNTLDFSVVPVECRKMIELMLNKNPDKRPMIAQILEHPYLKQTIAQLYQQKLLPKSVNNSPQPPPTVSLIPSPIMQTPSSVPQTPSPLIPAQQSILPPLPVGAKPENRVPENIVHPVAIEQPLKAAETPISNTTINQATAVSQDTEAAPANSHQHVIHEKGNDKRVTEKAEVASEVSDKNVGENGAISEANDEESGKPNEKNGEEKEAAELARATRVLHEWPQDDFDDNEYDMNINANDEKEIRNEHLTSSLHSLLKTPQVEFPTAILDFPTLHHNADDAETSKLVSQLEEHAKRAWAIAEAAYLHEVFLKKKKNNNNTKNNNNEAISLYLASLKLLVASYRSMRSIEPSKRTERSKAVHMWINSKFAELMERTEQLAAITENLNEPTSLTAEKLLLSYAIGIVKEIEFKEFRGDDCNAHVQRAKLVLEYLLFNSTVFENAQDREIISKAWRLVTHKQAQMNAKLAVGK